MCFAGLVAFAGGAGFEPVSAVLVPWRLALALFWQPDRTLSARMERVWLPLAALLVVRALVHVFVIRDDVVIPVVDLLLMLMAAEALRSLDAPNDVRLYALSFALVLASTAYRPGVLFLLAFVAYVALATVALMVGHLRRNAERHGLRDVPLGAAHPGTPRRASPASSCWWRAWCSSPSRGYPGLGGARGDPGHLHRRLRRRGLHRRVRLAHLRQPADRAAGGVSPRAPRRHAEPALAGRSYDHFDGVRWSRTRGLPPSSAPTRWYRERWQRAGGGAEDLRRASGRARALRAPSRAGHRTGQRHPAALRQRRRLRVLGIGRAVLHACSPGTASPVPPSCAPPGAGIRPPGASSCSFPRTWTRASRRLADSLTAGPRPRSTTRPWPSSGGCSTFRYTLELPATAAGRHPGRTSCSCARPGTASTSPPPWW